MSMSAVCPDCKQRISLKGDKGDMFAVHFANSTDIRPCPQSYKTPPLE